MKYKIYFKFFLLLAITFSFSLFNVNFINAEAKYDDEVKIVKVYYSSDVSYAIDESGRLWGWGGYDDGVGVLNADKFNRLLPLELMEGVKDVAAGISNCYVIKKDDTLWAWGWNEYGQLGDGTTIDKKTPVKIMDDVKKIFASYNQVAAIKNDNSLWMWGENSSNYAILGDGTKITKTSPVKIMENVKEVSLATDNLILQNDGKLWKVDSESRRPKLVEEFSIVKDIANGFYILDSNSTLIFYNTYLGKKIPVAEGVEKVFEGDSYNLYYLSKEGRLWGIGGDYLGDGTGSNDSIISSGIRQSPISFPGRVVDVSSGEDNCIVLLDDGTVWTWGVNLYGQAGNGSTSSVTVPTKISFSRKFASVNNAYNDLDYAPQKDIRIFYDGKEINLVAKPKIIDGRTLVPMKEICEKLGWVFKWNNSTKVAAATSSDSNITIQPGNKFAEVNGVKKSLDVPAQIISGRLMIPSNFLSDIMGYNMVSVNKSKLILLSKDDIIEWRYGGYEGAAGKHREYEYKYINGKKTSEYRYTGTYANPLPSSATNIKAESSESIVIPTQSTKKEKALSAEEIYALCAPSVFRIETFDKNGLPIGLGSGFFISSDGMAVTNYHVIEGASYVKVTLTDGSSYWADKILRSSETKDIAILKIKASGVKPLSIGDSTDIKGGQTIYTIGNPEGLTNTISDGIISNPNREINKTKYIQISAPISFGSSGGALINKYGQVIGITSAGIIGGQNLNLAIPINEIYSLASLE